MSFRFHDELLIGMLIHSKNVKLRIENGVYACEEPTAIFLTSEQISPVITGDSNSFLSVFSKGHCSDINMVKCRLKYFLFT